MNKNQVIESLQAQAKTNKVFSDVVHDFALRERARNIVTVQALKQRMKAERFNYSDKEYAETLEILARMGFGTIELDNKGKVKALKDIKVTLQSIGKVAVGADTHLDKNHFRNKFKPIITEVPAQVIPKPLRTELKSLSTVLSITLDVKGKPVVVTLPKDLSNEEIADLIGRFK